MNTANKISYYNSVDIDRCKWDRCIEDAANGLIYAHAFYLDMMSCKWDALVLNDYEAVMPLTWKRKYGFYYLYQPYFIPALGIFGNNLAASSTLDFLSAVPKKFRYWDVDLNETNAIDLTKISGAHGRIRMNHFLQLDRPYETTIEGYNRLCLRMIRKANHHQVQIVRDGSPVDVIAFYVRHYKTRHSEIAGSVYEKLTRCTNHYFGKGMVKVYLAKLPDGEIIAAYLVLVDKRFVYSLIGGSTDKGKLTGAFYLLTDAAIKDHAGSGRMFRFEGSDIKGVAFFDAQFGAHIINFQRITRNTLPFPVSLFKT